MDMWKIFGKETMYLDIPRTVKALLISMSADSEKGSEFKDLIDKTTITFLLNGETEESSIFIRVPDDLTPANIQLMADVFLDVAKNTEMPFITVKDIEQRYNVIFTNDHEPELIGLNKTPGMSSAEVFKPIFKSLDGRGRMNADFDR